MRLECVCCASGFALVGAFLLDAKVVKIFGIRKFEIRKMKFFANLFA